ncbi:hypothetical protein SSYRP_v1c00400 [Spiroplasma syrphidicola EA-1]|uniref:Uncharacterized protein n=1 Tax=Spiroplasma syrphidicola EA-1 TaxID=1276229 RepID=R4UK44_9MOLU|nr:hypothetical protein [Spiroplasma syrphidicola]AGM25636.1 hypothetical protein SSYRP_v1c00400 [Spiroplasma syrphidicola EA-1]
MYINPFERMKGLKTEVKNESTLSNSRKELDYDMLAGNLNKGQMGILNQLHSNNKPAHNEPKPANIRVASREFQMTDYEIIKDISKTLKNTANDVQFYLALYNHDGNLISEISESLFLMPVVNINVAKNDLYLNPFLFLLKKIVKGLPKISFEDKKVLWDRIKLFARLLKSDEIANKKVDANSEVIINELEFDDPIEYIRKEFEEIIRAYDLKEKFVIVFSKINDYKKFKNTLNLIEAIFQGLPVFKFIIGVNENVLDQYGQDLYGTNLTDNLQHSELSIYAKKYLLREENTEENYDGEEAELEDSFLSTAELDEPVEKTNPPKYDYWAMRNKVPR